MGVIDKVSKFFWSPLEKAKEPRSYVMDESETTYTREHGADYKTNRGTLEDYLQTYEISAWVYVCVSRIMSAVAQVPLKVWRRKGTKRDDWEDLTVKEPDHQLVKLLQKPNPWMTEYELKQNIMGHLELGGNAYLEVVGDGIPQELYTLLPYKMKIIPDSKTYISGYVYEVLASGGIRYKPEEIIHLRYFHPRSQYYGLSPIQASELSVISDLNATEYNKNFFKNSAIPDGFLTTDQELNDGAYRRLRKMWQQAHQGVDKSHRIAIGELGLKWMATSLNAKDMEFINSRKLSREEIMCIYGVFPAIAGILESSSYGALNEQKRFFWEITIPPKLFLVENRLNAELVPRFKDENLYIEFDTTVIQAIRENRESEARVASAFVDRGILTVNESRRRIFGLGPVAWGDVWHPPQAGGLAVDKVQPAQSTNPGDKFADSKGTKLGPGPKGADYSQGKQPDKFPSTDKMGKLMALPDIMQEWSETEGDSEVSPFQLVRSKLSKTP